LDHNCLKRSQDTKRANKEQLNLTPSDDFAGAVFGLSEACKQNMKYKKLLQMSNEKLIYKSSCSFKRDSTGKY